ncbi:hypothetical protein KM043_000131 [Ampulex compressa]|nr:hypothetical protein KM043_000131 [Ampulex compressa]
MLLERLIKDENRLNIEGEATSAFFAVSLSDRKSNKDKRYKKQDSRAQSKVKCFYCKKKGNMARECYKKQRDKQKEAEKVKKNTAFVASVSQGGNNKLPVVLFCKEEPALNSMHAGTIWLTDSGATLYMTYRREWLTDFEPTNGELVSLGNNEQCKVTSSGTVTIDKWINGKWEEARIETNVLLVPDIKETCSP